MRRTLLQAVLTACALGAAANVASAHSVFSKALKAKYEFRAVSCHTCHVPRAALPANAPPNSVQNEFGKLFALALKRKDVNAKVAESTALKKMARQAATEAEEEQLKLKAEAIDNAVTKDFLKALQKVEAMQDPASGKTYGELLKAGQVEGVK